MVITICILVIKKQTSQPVFGQRCWFFPYENVLFVTFGKPSSIWAEEVTLMNDETFVPLKMLHSDEQKQILGGYKC